MTILQLNKGPGAKSLITCDNCGATYECLTSIILNRKSKKHYCDIDCRFARQKKYASYNGSYKDKKYRLQERNERKDSRLKKKDMVKKRCLACGRIYYGPPGNFPKSRDKNKPEPGLCGCTTTTFYSEEDLHGQAI